jgi:hypothetical protein
LYSIVIFLSNYIILHRRKKSILSGVGFDYKTERKHDSKRRHDGVSRVKEVAVSMQKVKEHYESQIKCIELT